MTELEEQGEPEKTKERETPENNDPTKGPSPMIIIIASVVVLVLIVGAIYFIAFSGSEVESLAVGNIYKESDHIELLIYATPSGIGDYTGDVTVEVYFEEQTEPLYSSKVRINDGQGLEQIDYNEFVWDNGEYTVMASADGKESTGTFRINNVVTSLYVEWQGINSDSQMLTPDYQVEVNVTYQFGDLNRPLADFPRGYEFSGTLDRPEGPPVTFTSDEFSSALYKLQKRVDHTIAGDYSLTGALTNTFCKINSPYKTVSVGSNGTYTFDAHPFAVAGDDVATTLSGNEAVITFDGSGSWDDGTITTYEWDFGDNTTGSSSSPAIQHTYTETGVFYVELTLTDDKGQISTKQSGLISTLSVTVG